MTIEIEKLEKESDNDIIVKRLERLATFRDPQVGEREALIAYLSSRASRRLIEYTHTLINETRILRNLTCVLLFLTIVLAGLGIWDRYEKWLESHSRNPHQSNMAPSSFQKPLASPIVPKK